MTADPYNYTDPARLVDSARHDPYAAPTYGNRSVPFGQPQSRLNEHGGRDTLPAYRMVVIGLTGGFSSGDG